MGFGENTSALSSQSFMYYYNIVGLDRLWSKLIETRRFRLAYY